MLHEKDEFFFCLKPKCLRTVSLSGLKNKVQQQRAAATKPCQASITWIALELHPVLAVITEHLDE